MTDETTLQTLKDAVLAALEETFENVHGMYLDPGTSLFETLETLSATDASQSISSNCATIAAHVEHMRVSIAAVMKYMQGESPKVDWTEVWRTIGTVTDDEWRVSKDNLQEAYHSLRKFIKNLDDFEGNINLVLSTLMHNAYHLGEIRHALCTLK